MIVVVSTLSLNDTDRRFYSFLKKAVWPEPVLILNPGYLDLLGKVTGMRMGWDLRGWQKNAEVVPTEMPASVDLAKHAHRLRHLPGHEMPLEEAEAVCSRYAGFWSAFLKQTRPRLLMALNPLIPHTQIPVEIARSVHIPCLALERGVLPDTYLLDEHGYGGFSDISRMDVSYLVEEEKSRCQKAWRNYQERQGTPLMPRYTKQAGTLAEKLVTEEQMNRNVLFLGAADTSNAFYPVDHTEHDVNMPFFETSDHIASRLRAAFGNGFRYKPHPSVYQTLEGREQELNVTTLSPDDCIEWADVVVVNGSSLEFVALARGKPVVYAGRGYLSGKEIVYEIQTDTDLASVVEHALRDGLTETMVNNYETFMGYYAEKMAVEASTFHAFFRMARSKVGKIPLYRLFQMGWGRVLKMGLRRGLGRLNAV